MTTWQNDTILQSDCCCQHQKSKAENRVDTFPSLQSVRNWSETGFVLTSDHQHRIESQLHKNSHRARCAHSITELRSALFTILICDLMFAGFSVVCWRVLHALCVSLFFCYHQHSICNLGGTTHTRATVFSCCSICYCFAFGSFAAFYDTVVWVVV